ncbi:MAG: hypothetical protein MZV70_43255 [Desulfobacterales bacterium]|nr:hypothetical protein [Desulfobacterales bacterium]
MTRAEPGVPVIDEIGTVSGSFTVDWSDAAGASSYALQRLSGLQTPLDDPGDGGPFDRVNWIVTGSQYHSPSQCHRSNGTGSLTWQQTVTIPPAGWTHQFLEHAEHQPRKLPGRVQRELGRRPELVLPTRPSAAAT